MTGSLRLTIVGVPASEVSQARVAEHVACGGHNIPVEDIDRRYGRSMAALPGVLAIVDTAALYEYDNAGDQQRRIVSGRGRSTTLAPPESENPIAHRLPIAGSHM